MAMNGSPIPSPGLPQTARKHPTRTAEKTTKAKMTIEDLQIQLPREKA
jgi:hypothetical protein